VRSDPYPPHPSPLREALRALGELSETGKMPLFRRRRSPRRGNLLTRKRMSHWDFIARQDYLF